VSHFALVALFALGPQVPRAQPAAAGTPTERAAVPWIKSVLGKVVYERVGRGRQVVEVDLRLAGKA
jgi:hypothetical protein